MALWLVRAGRHGQYANRFLDEGRIYLTWRDLKCDLIAFTKPSLREKLIELYPTFSKSKISNSLGQIWGFSHGIQKGDWIALPSKHKPAIHMAKVNGERPDGSVDEVRRQCFSRSRIAAAALKAVNFLVLPCLRKRTRIPGNQDQPNARFPGNRRN